jgi:hypothetical protein
MHIISYWSLISFSMTHGSIRSAAAGAGLLLALLPAAIVAAADRLQAEVICQPVEQDELAYDCAIRLRDGSGNLLAGAEMMVGADMPSMPMAHNVVPVRAVPGATPGVYAVRLNLEMHGEWAVKMRLTKPRNDQLVRRLRFEPGRVAAPARR